RLPRCRRPAAISQRHGSAREEPETRGRSRRGAEGVMKIRTICLVLTVIFGATGSVAARTWTGTATANLGFSGAKLVVTSSDYFMHPADHRRLILIGPNGAKRTVRLHDGGGHAGPSSLNLYRLDGGSD